jgi:hypothetical protein
MILLYVLGAAEVLAVGAIATYVRAALRNPQRRSTKRGSGPILLDGWSPPPGEGHDRPSVHP